MFVGKLPEYNITLTPTPSPIAQALQDGSRKREERNRTDILLQIMARAFPQVIDYNARGGRI